MDSLVTFDEDETRIENAPKEAPEDAADEQKFLEELSSQIIDNLKDHLEPLSAEVAQIAFQVAGSTSLVAGLASKMENVASNSENVKTHLFGF